MVIGKRTDGNRTSFVVLPRLVLTLTGSGPVSARMSFNRLIPKEHGAWGVLFVSLAIGLGASHRFGGEGLLLLLGVLSLFLARQPVLTFFRERRLPKGARTQTPEALLWIFSFACLGGLTLLPLLLSGRPLLLAFGVTFAGLFAFHLLLLLRHKDRTHLGEITGVLGLTLAAPMAYYVSTGTLGRQAWLLYLLCVLFFSGGIFLVKMKIRAHLEKRDLETLSQRLSYARAAFLYHLVMLLAVSALILSGLAPRLVFLAFLPSALQAFFEVASLSPRLQLKRAGFTLLGHSVLFGLVLTLAL